MVIIIRMNAGLVNHNCKQKIIKFMKHKISISIFVLFAIILVSCKKNTYKVVERTSNEGSAQVKLGYLSAYSVAPNTILYINDLPVSNTLVAPFGFPGGGLNINGSTNGDYLFVTPGTVKIQGFRPIPATGNIMTKLFEFSQAFSANTNYTFYITDTSASTAGFSIEDTKTKPDSGFARFKFVNAMPNVAAIDLYKGTNNTTATLYQSNIAYKAASASFDLPVPVIDSFFIRPAGAASTTVPMARRPFTLTNQRIYTMLARGYNGSTSATLVPQLSVIINQ
jgi:hypothetical protein